MSLFHQFRLPPNTPLINFTFHVSSLVTITNTPSRIAWFRSLFVIAYYFIGRHCHNYHSHCRLLRLVVCFNTGLAIVIPFHVLRFRRSHEFPFTTNACLKSRLLTSHIA